MDARLDIVIPLLKTGKPARGAIVLRSFGKTYGLAGLRLGFAVASPDIAAPLRAAIGDWSVSGPAIEIGARAFEDEDWFAAMKDRLAVLERLATDPRKRLSDEIDALGGPDR